MKFKISVLILVFASMTAIGQNKILWTADIVITEDSFQDTTPDLSVDNVQEFFFHTTYEFGYQMTNAQFALTKNFNSYVEAYYIPKYSWIESGELMGDLLTYANLQFDVSELFARKFRKKLYEAKKFGSRTNFFIECHDSVQNEYAKFSSEINSKLRSETEWNHILKQYSDQVNTEIEELAEYCITCKIKKKKKKR